MGVVDKFIKCFFDRVSDVLDVNFEVRVFGQFMINQSLDENVEEEKIGYELCNFCFLEGLEVKF